MTRWCRSRPGGGRSLGIDRGAGWGAALRPRPRSPSLLASARIQALLPEVDPARTVLNRLWPLLLSMLGAAGWPSCSAGPGDRRRLRDHLGVRWRRQSSAVTAIEERDGARFYVERTSPLQPIQLVRTPGFRSNLIELNGTLAPRPARPRA